MPSWVAAALGIFCIFGTIGFLALIVLVSRLIQTINEIKPKVDLLTERVNSMAEKLESAADSAKNTVETVGSGTRAMVGSLQGLVVGSADRLGKFSTYIVTAMTLLRLYKEFSSLRAARQVDTEGDSES